MRCPAQDIPAAILPPLTLTEIFYVAERVYQEEHTQEQSEILAKKLYDFVYYHPYVESEMKKNINELNNRFNLKFLEDFS